MVIFDRLIKIKERQIMFDNIKTYKDFTDRLGNLILCNNIASHDIKLIHGEPIYEIFQYYIISDPSFAINHTNELIFYDKELDLYILGVTHFGVNWNYIPALEFH